MKLKDKKIAIVGGGPGGLTLARILQLRGVDVKVYERDVDQTVRVQGSPLDLHEESGLKALLKAGLLAEFRKSFLPGADRKKIVDPQGIVYFSDHESKQEENFGNAGFRPEIDRGTLRQLLLTSLRPGTLQWDRHFVTMEKHHSGWMLHFKNSVIEYADIVVAADGANSKIRPYITEIKPFYTGITMLEGTVANASRKVPQVHTLVNGGKIMAFGNEKNLLMGQKGKEELGFYASFKAEESWAVQSQLDFGDNHKVLEWFRNTFYEWSEFWNELFENASVAFVPRPIYCMPLGQNWESQANLTIIGDAAHVMPPFAGEGVNMAMLDALELAENLLSDNYQTISDAIKSFEINMRKRATKAAKESLENGETMHAENALENILNFFEGHIKINQ
ncbi:FAD-dependent oxidoreductase [Robertkochia solimangrovi]|uniref:FAD-dependent oxidoreductase n=1 Tax=Robertkochia solimangrovi TaxID=2213046 RepID=UPI00117C270F|nr:NAD(P)/FAD-dependent oxidoreductase [Robertkochia solimangrovi]TRZ41624.1 FAD-dependent monooxygenase [Robertkochia solimangrovi]